jgi:hypothetical protein
MPGSEASRRPAAYPRAPPVEASGTREVGQLAVLGRASVWSFLVTKRQPLAPSKMQIAAMSVQRGKLAPEPRPRGFTLST